VDVPAFRATLDLHGQLARRIATVRTELG